jgi:hypothetical protein
MATQPQQTSSLAEKLLQMSPSDFSPWVETSLETANRIREVVTDEVSSGKLPPIQAAGILGSVFGELFVPGNSPRGGAGGGDD